MCAKISPDLKRDIRQYVMERLEKNVAYAEIISPYQLSKQDVERYKKQISGLDRMHLFNTVDESLMAGIIIRLGSKMIDLSLKSQLENLKQRLYEST